jgi:thioredoxin reductase
MKVLNGYYAVIGAGPSGLAAARNLQKRNISFIGFEAHDDVGGLWDIENPNSTVYRSAHLISSKKMTEFNEFPMKEGVADYPSHVELGAYFKDFAKHFGLYDHYRFKTFVKEVKKTQEGKWEVKTNHGEYLFDGVIIANGTLSEANIPSYEGKFNGEIFHAKKYKTPEIFKNKRVLIVGAGNSGCDIAVDAVHHASSIDMSVRRGYHFVPKYIMGKPADSIGGKIKLPPRLKQKVDSKILKLFTGDPTRFGFPEPDHKLYESHPIVNSLVLHYIGHGDINVMPSIERLDGDTVYFSNGTSKDYDIILLATGYKLHYPFIKNEHLNTTENTPELFLNIFPPHEDSLFVVGLVEAAGIGWQGRYNQAELVSLAIDSKINRPKSFQSFKKRRKKNNEDLRGGMEYMKLARMSYYVHKDTYLKKMKKYSELLSH